MNPSTLCLGYSGFLVISSNIRNYGENPTCIRHLTKLLISSFESKSLGPLIAKFPQDYHIPTAFLTVDMVFSAKFRAFKDPSCAIRSR